MHRHSQVNMVFINEARVTSAVMCKYSQVKHEL